MSRAQPSAGPEARARAWEAQPPAVLAVELAVRGGEPPRGAHVLKRKPRRLVLRLDAAGPAGEAVVVKIARLPTAAGWLPARIRRSGAEVQRRGASLLLASGLETAAPLAALTCRDVAGRWWSAYLSRAVDDAEPLRAALARLDGRHRVRLARALGRFIAQLHASGVYVPDLKDDNILVRSDPRGSSSFVLIDLDRVRRPRLGLSRRRRLANLVQLDRTLGWLAVERERVALLGAYRRALPVPRPRLAILARALDRARRRKDRAVARRRRRLGIVPDERMALSCIVVTGDEIGRIRDCLESVAWCDELVVVDSFSSDGTFAVCREYTAQVVRHAWSGYRDQKAFALSLAKHPWVLNLDADERVSPELRAEIDAVLRADGYGYDGFLVPRLVRYLGRWWRRGGWYPDRRLRLFRRERATWGGVDPHEHVVLRGRVGRLGAPLWHFTYDGVADHVATINRFTSIATGGDRRRRVSRVTWADLTLRPLARFVRFYVLRGGLWMGLPGLFVALSAALYVHLKYAKRDELARSGGAPA